MQPGVPMTMGQQQQHMMQQQQHQQQQQQQLGGGGGGGGGGPHSQSLGPPPPQQQQQQQQQQHHPPQHHHPLGLPMHPEARLDNISKAKALISPIKDTLSNVLRNAAGAIYANNMVDSGSKPVEYDVSKFDRSFEEFFTLCDQLEVHLKSSIECISQGMSSHNYLQTPAVINRMDGNLAYPHYISVIKGQIAYAKEVHTTLAETALKLE